jgi:hypothetical protein
MEQLDSFISMAAYGGLKTMAHQQDGTTTGLLEVVLLVEDIGQEKSMPIGSTLKL